MRPDQDYQIDAVARRLAEIEGTVRRQRMAAIGLNQSIKEAWIEGDQKGQPGPPPPIAAGIRVLTKGCDKNCPIEGVHFTVKVGSDVITDFVTGSDGIYTLALDPGNYSVILDDTAYVTTTGLVPPITAGMGVTTGINTQSFFLIPDRSLTLTDSFGSHTMPRVAGGWKVCYEVTTGGKIVSGSLCVAATVTTAIRYTLGCTGVGGWDLSQEWLLCFPTIGSPSGLTTNSCASFSTGVGVHNNNNVGGGCYPFSLGFTFDSTNECPNTSVTVS